MDELEQLREFRQKTVCETYAILAALDSLFLTHPNPKLLKSVFQQKVKTAWELLKDDPNLSKKAKLLAFGTMDRMLKNLHRVEH